jgi:ABC-2 type transport system ATP-binding protein
MSGAAVVEATGLVKRYGEVCALAGIDLEVCAGEVLGYLGRNGAGKTTTLRILAGLVRPTQGTARVLGHEAFGMPASLRQRCGYLSDAPPPFGWMRVSALLDLAASVNPRWDDAYDAELVKRLDVPLDEKVATLSLGQGRRLGLVLALAPRPDLLLLDEPMGGLDPAGRRELLDLLVEFLARDGTTAILSSHLLADVERLSTHIAILEQGRLLHAGRTDALQDSVCELDIELEEPVETLEAPGALRVEHRGLSTWRVTVTGDREEVLASWTARLPQARIEARPLSLEEIFLAYVGGSHG